MIKGQLVFLWSLLFFVDTEARTDSSAKSLLWEHWNAGNQLFLLSIKQTAYTKKKTLHLLQG